jgi:SAM-dependent methyltransferase
MSLITKPLVWKEEYDRYHRFQRNHKSYSIEELRRTLENQFKEIRLISKFMTQAPVNVMDIGCGLGIYDVALNFFYPDSLFFHLVDKTTTAVEEANIFYGYKEKGAFYNNLDLTKDFLIANGVQENRIIIHPVTDNQEESNAVLSATMPQIDLAISIISCGFHYPASTYIDLVADKLRANGLFVLNCRNLEENVPALETKFVICHPPPEQRKNGSLFICKKK